MILLLYQLSYAAHFQASRAAGERPTVGGGCRAVKRRTRTRRCSEGAARRVVRALVRGPAKPRAACSWCPADRRRLPSAGGLLLAVAGGRLGGGARFFLGANAE